MIMMEFYIGLVHYKGWYTLIKLSYGLNESEHSNSTHGTYHGFIPLNLCEVIQASERQSK